MEIKPECEYTETEKNISSKALEKGFKPVFFKDEPDAHIQIDPNDKDSILTIKGCGKFMLLGPSEYVGSFPPHQDVSISGDILDSSGNRIPIEDMSAYQKSMYEFVNNVRLVMDVSGI